MTEVTKSFSGVPVAIDVALCLSGDFRARNPPAWQRGVAGKTKKALIRGGISASSTSKLPGPGRKRPRPVPTYTPIPARGNVEHVEHVGWKGRYG